MQGRSNRGAQQAPGLPKFGIQVGIITAKFFFYLNCCEEKEKNLAPILPPAKFFWQPCSYHN